MQCAKPRMTPEPLSIASRFCGPSSSGNGGYVCGRLAAHLPGTVSVRLQAPPPLDTGLQVAVAGSAARLLQGAEVIAEAKTAVLDLMPPACPSAAEAQAASRAYPGFKHHPFPQCFVCGPQRAAGDGLRIFTGPVASRAMVACIWVPDTSLTKDDERVPEEFLWAALDCPGAFAVMPVPAGRALVLGEFCVRIDQHIAVGEECIVIGWPLQIEGRKRLAGSALFTSAGTLVAVGRATWIEVPASAFGGM